MKQENSPPTDAEQVESEQLHAMLEASLSNDSPAPTAADGPERTPKAEPVYEGYPADPDFQLRGGYDNLMLDAAAPLFGLVIRLRTLDALPNIKDVHQQVRNQIENVREEMRQHGYEPAQLLAYSNNVVSCVVFLAKRR